MRTPKAEKVGELSDKDLAKLMRDGSFYMGHPVYRAAMGEAAKRLEKLAPGTVVVPDKH